MTWQYVLFYKPYGVLCQFCDGRRSVGDHRTSVPRPTLKDYIPIPHIYPVGRLDLDSEGLLLLTNHGRVQQHLCEPRFGHPRTYWVQVERIPDAVALDQLRQGVTIKQHRTRPAQVNLIAPPDLPPRDPPVRYRKTVPTAWLEMTLTEGRNRQVRRMTAAVGFPTLRLVRVAAAHLTLQNMTPGQWRTLSSTEIETLHRLIQRRA